MAIVTDKNGKIIEELNTQLVSGESSAASFERLISGRRYRATDTEARLAVRIRLNEGETMTILGEQEACSTCKGWMKNAAGTYKGKYVYQWWENGELKVWETWWNGAKVVTKGN